MLKTKSVWSPIDRRRDGLRTLATRFRGRGLPASRYDVWMPALGPSEKLLRDVQAGRISWAAFVREYRRAEDEMRCHRHELRKLILRRTS